MRKYLSSLMLLVSLAACNAPDVPSEPPELTTPPEVATTGFLTAYTEQTIAMTPAAVRAFMVQQPLISFLEPTDSISNPVASDVMQGQWPEPGATRWLRLADGHYVVERIIENRADFFKYQVFIFTNAAGRGLDQIVGEQRFVPTDTGTRLEWTYNVLPRNFVTRQFVRGNMDEIQNYIANGLQRFALAANTAAGN